MRRSIVVTALVVGLCATSRAQEPILEAMLAASEIVAHVKVLDIQGGEMEEQGVVEWAALCEVIGPIKGGLQKTSKVRFRFNQFTTGGDEESVVVRKDRQYVVFLAGQSGGVRFAGDDGVKVAYRLVDRWVGVLPYHPHLIRRLTQLAGKPSDTAENTRLATSPGTPHAVRFAAVRGLAMSPYTAESANALAQVACDSKAGETTRIYAAMGLSNFTSHLPEDLKTAIRKKLRGALAREGPDTPDGIIRTLLAWGDAPCIHEILGDKLVGHSMEIDVLDALPGEWACERLWQLYLSSPKSRKAEHYSTKAKIGRVLAMREDKRGIDILIGLLPAESAPSPQYRSNVYNFLALKLRRDFGYKMGNYRPELEQAIPKMIGWWQENRETFTFRQRLKPLD